MVRPVLGVPRVASNGRGLPQDAGAAGGGAGARARCQRCVRTVLACATTTQVSAMTRQGHAPGCAAAAAEHTKDRPCGTGPEGDQPFGQLDRQRSRAGQRHPVSGLRSGRFLDFRVVVAEHRSPEPVQAAEVARPALVVCRGGGSFAVRRATFTQTGSRCMGSDQRPRPGSLGRGRGRPVQTAAAATATA